MNSEFLKDQIKTLEEAEYETVKQMREAEASTQTCGELAGSFKNHQFWKVFEKDANILKDKLIKQLVCFNGQRQEMMRLQTEIKCITIFLETPDKYIDRLNSLLSRKRRERG
jgi:negative regulator of sigma E activity